MGEEPPVIEEMSVTGSCPDSEEIMCSKMIYLKGRDPCLVAGTLGLVYLVKLGMVLQRHWNP